MSQQTDENLMISVVTVSYNQGQFIQQNIESVLQQNYENFEHIVVDGGSTDKTVEILKSYPHLKWTSEPDNGQTDALNKGFRRAKGNIIAWLNSDDWYAPDIFHKIADQLERYPILVTRAEVTDAQGNTTETIPAVGRTWYDLAKYWPYHSVPPQPAIFFRRDLLEQVVRHDGKYLDEDLDYCMDFDFWLRLANQYGMTACLDMTTAYLRMWEENKSSTDKVGFQREYSQVYRRHASIRSKAEQKLSFAVPVNADTTGLEKTLESLNTQSLFDMEAVVIDYSENKEKRESTASLINDLRNKLPALRLRQVSSKHKNFYGAINQAVESCGSSLISVLRPGDTVSPDFCITASNLFETDIIGISLPSRSFPELTELFLKQDESPGQFDINKLFRFPPLFFPFIARKIALMEIGGIRSPASPVLAFRELLLRLFYKSWHINVDNKFEINYSNSTVQPAEIDLAKGTYVNAQLISDLDKEFKTDPFASIRLMHGFTFVFPEPIVSNAESLLSRAPKNWHAFDYSSPIDQLEKLSEQYPSYSPLWFALAKRYQASGLLSETQHAQQMYLKTTEEEKKF